MRGGGLQGRELTVVRQGRSLLSGVDLDLEPGETVGVIGPSGAGKTTLVHALCGLAPLAGGGVTWEGRALLPGRPGDRSALRRVVQPLFQDPGESLNPRRRVAEVVATGAPGGRLAATEVAALLSRVGLGAGLADRYPHQLSGGERQRVALARALAVRPRVLLLDEPFASLDPPLCGELRVGLQGLVAEGLSLLLVTHDLADLVGWVDRVGVLAAGRFVEWGRVVALVEAPLHPLTATLVACHLRPERAPAWQEGTPASSGCPFHPTCPRAGEGCAAADPPLAGVTPGRWVACHHPYLVV